MSFDMYGEKAAQAAALICQVSGKKNYHEAFGISSDSMLELFSACMDQVREVERKACAAPQDNVPGVSELPVVKTWEERFDERHPNAPGGAKNLGMFDRVYWMEHEIADLRAALRAYGQRAAVPIMDGKHKQFEAWAKSNGYCVDMKGNQKAYPSANTQSAWEIWQAAIDTQYSVPGISKNIAEGGKDA